MVEELKQQVSEKGAELEKERQGKAAGAERVKALEAELVGVKGSVMRLRMRNMKCRRWLRS